MRARSCGACATGCASSGRGCAARSSRTCAARTRRSTCSSRSSPIATAATCWSCAPSTASAIPGIVHGSSGSGASLFLEPLSTVEINNDIVALEQQEAEEVHRILLALSDAFRRRGDDLRADGGSGDRARRAAGAGAASRSLVDGDRAGDRRPTAGWSCAAARHPLLIPAAQRHLGIAMPTTRRRRDGPTSETRAGAGRRPADPAGHACSSSPGRTPAARPSRSRPPGCCR